MDMSKSPVNRDGTPGGVCGENYYRETSEAYNNTDKPKQTFPISRIQPLLC